MSKKLTGLTCLGAVLALVQTNAVMALDSSCVGWWKFDESAGTTAADSSPSGNTGTVQGTLRWTSGQIDGALYFDGTTTYVELPTATGSVVKSLTDCTFAIWACWTGPAETSISQRIFEFGSSGSSYMYLSPSMGAGSPARYVIRSSLGGQEEWVDAATALDNAWHHVVVTIDSTSTMTLYLDGAVSGTATMARNKLSYMGATFYHYVGRSSGEPPFFKGYLDDFYIFNRVLSQAEIVKLQLGGGLGRDFASKPSPADKQTEVLRDVTLSWTAGISADRHNVYLGDNLEDVNKAGVGSPLLVGPGQNATTYDPGRLDFSQTYYWRVDEVNPPPDKTVFKGDVWSFTVEPYAYPIPGESITPSASSPSPGESYGPERTIDNSGLNAQDLHSNKLADMWLTAKGTSLPAWIQYELGTPYRLDEMRVWNFNGASLLALCGAREVLVEHSMDGVNWTPLSGVPEFPKAPGTMDHASDITVDFGDVAAQYVRITIKSNYAGGASKQCGLSEVRLMAVPMAARNPSPDPDANNLDPRSILLTWRPGREANHHQVYLSDQASAVREGTAPVRTTNESQLAGSQFNLSLGRTYYWRVDEVNNVTSPSVWPGELWSFATVDSIVVDDFESYYNSSPNRPFQTWIDGLGFTEPQPGNPGNNTGAVLGHGVSGGSIMETTIVNSGLQSLPLYYDNSGAGGHLNYSQIDRTFAEAQDWTQFGITRLVVHFYGSLANTGQLYVKINDTKIPYSGAAADIATEAWTPWEIDLTSRAALVRNVSTLSIGIDGSGASGLLYIDDIWLR